MYVKLPSTNNLQKAKDLKCDILLETGFKVRGWSIKMNWSMNREKNSKWQDNTYCMSNCLQQITCKKQRSLKCNILWKAIEIWQAFIQWINIHFSTTKITIYLKLQFIFNNISISHWYNSDDNPADSRTIDSDRIYMYVCNYLNTYTWSLIIKWFSFVWRQKLLTAVAKKYSNRFVQIKCYADLSSKGLSILKMRTVCMYT